MTDPSAQIDGSATADAENLRFVGEIDRSCRFIVSALFTKAVSWLALAMLVQLIVSIQLVFPGFLSACPWMTYGKLVNVSQSALIYGFLIQAFLGLSIWMTARLGGVALERTGHLIVGLGGWNLGVLTAVIGIMAGFQAGYEWFNIPPFSIPLLLVSYGVLAFSVLMNLYHRDNRILYPSLWFILGGVLWFPWVATAAYYLLHINPVQGAMQALVASWFGKNLSLVCMPLFGFGIALYLIPKLTGKALQERHLIVFGFWALVIIGSWGGVSLGAPFPAWIPALSAVTSVAIQLAIVPLMVSLWATDGDCRGHFKDPVLRWITVALASLIFVLIIDTLLVFRLFNALLDYTLVVEARQILLLWGFCGFMVFAGIYHVTEEIFGFELPDKRFVELHFLLSLSGLVLIVLALLVGGFLQGLILVIPQTPFIYAVKTYKPFLWVFGLGVGLFSLAQALAFINLTWQWCLHYCTCCVPQSRVPATLKTETNVEAEA